MRALSLACAVLTAGCAAQMPAVTADYDRAADFTAYKTIAFLADLGEAKGSFTTINEQRVRKAVRMQLERRGYQFVEAEPDLVVNLTGKLAHKQEVHATSTGSPYPYRYGYGGWGGGQTVVTTEDVTEGTLRVDVVDAKKKQLVWQATAKGKISDEMREDFERILFEIVGDMFDKYPFRAAGAPPPQ